MKRVGLIGVGKWGKVLKELKRESKIEYRSESPYSLSTLLFEDEIEYAIISTPANTHYKIAKELIENKINVLIESPMCTSYAESLDLLALSEIYGIRISVGNIMLYVDGVRNLKEMIKEDNIKYINMIRTQYGPIREDVTCVFDLMIHDLSILCYFFPKDEATLISSVGDANTVHAILDLSGITVFIHTSRKNRNRRRLLEIVGEKATYVYDDAYKFECVVNGVSYPILNVHEPLREQLLDFLFLKYNNKSKGTIGSRAVLLAEEIETNIALGM